MVYALKKYLRPLIKGFINVLLSPIALVLRLCGVRLFLANFQAIGHLSIDLDVYLRECQLLKTRRWNFLLAPHPSLVANRFLLNCWKQHFTVISHPLLVFFLSPLLKSPWLTYDPEPFFATPLMPCYSEKKIASEIYRKHSEQHPSGEWTSLLRLREEDRKRGENSLRRLGVPEGAWYVCFHCREKGYKSEESEKWASCRNASISRLEQALQEVVQRGGWCIRLGSFRTEPLPENLKKSPRIIDYPHTTEVSDFMDIFLVATCRFFLGNNSGLMATAGVFGTPCLSVNVVPFGMRTHLPKDLVIYKLHRSKLTQELIPFSACLRLPLCSSISLIDYENAQVELVENSPEEILEATREMLDVLERGRKPSGEEEALHQKFIGMLHPYTLHYRAPSRVGASFLKKYQDLLRRP